MTDKGEPVRKSHQVGGHQKMGVPEPSRAGAITVPMLQHLSKGNSSEINIYLHIQVYGTGVY